MPTCKVSPTRRGLLATLASAPLGSVCAAPATAQIDSLVFDGNKALRNGDAAKAQQAFERAAGARHDPKIEIGLIQSFMAQGMYKRALNFASHTAGAHDDEPDAAALYSWLLYIGGQIGVARSLVTRALLIHRSHPLLIAIERRMSAKVKVEDRFWMPPAFMRPAAISAPGFEVVPARSVCVGTALLTGNENTAEFYSQHLKPAPFAGEVFWLRSGLGYVQRARVISGLQDSFVTRLELSKPIRFAGLITRSSRQIFPGSVFLSMHFDQTNRSNPAWPIMRSNFVGVATADQWTNVGAIALNKHGEVIGTTLDQKSNVQSILPFSKLNATTGVPVSKDQSSNGPAINLDDVYESILASVFQVLKLPAKAVF